MSFIGKRFGFTLLEILIAVFLSGIIMVGLYELFNSVLSARVFSETKQDKTEIVYKVVSLIQRDIRCKVGDFYVTYRDGKRVLNLNTTDSLFYGGSVVVSASYYTDEIDGKVYLVREEENDDLNEDIAIPLTDYFKNIKLRFYHAGEWTDIVSPIVKITLCGKNKKISFVARGMI